MATPTGNFVSTTAFNPLSTGLGRYLADGTKWGGGLGSAVTLTYSFPGAPTAYFLPPYTEYSTWYATTSAEQAAIRHGLVNWSSVARVGFYQVADNSGTVGELRFALTDYANFAHAYFPSNHVKAGDVWFRQGSWNTDRGSVTLGDYDYLTIIHEIGHAIGLKHPFSGPYVMPDAYDNFFYTVMSYSASPWTNDNYASFYPTTPMYFDLLAIQAMYGRNPNHNASHTTYNFYDGSTYFQTIDDAGGVDMIVFNGADNARIDLRIGTYSHVSEPIYFTGGVSSRSTVWIGPNTIIERAMGGEGHDTLIGNNYGNLMLGRGGNDSIAGLGGNDPINGNAGNDTLNGGPGNDIIWGSLHQDRFVFNTALSATTNVDRIVDMVPAYDSIVLENAIFRQLVYTGTMADYLFWAGPRAHDANDRIIYQPGTGALLYDADGSGPRAAVKFATLTPGLGLTAADFTVI